MSAIAELQRAWKAAAGTERIFAQFVPKRPPSLPYAVVSSNGSVTETAPDGTTAVVEDFLLRVRYDYGGGSLATYSEGREFVRKVVAELGPPFSGAELQPDLVDPAFLGMETAGFTEFTVQLRAG